MRYVYALDVSLNCTGLVVFSNDAKDIVYVDSIDTKKQENHQMKLKMIADKLYGLRETYYPECVAFEQGFYRFANSTESIYKVFGVIQYVFYDVPQFFYPPMTVKKGVCGRGNVQKEEVKDRVLELYPSISFKNLDESDAAAVGICHFNKIRGNND